MEISDNLKFAWLFKEDNFIIIGPWSLINILLWSLKLAREVSSAFFSSKLLMSIDMKERAHV